MFTIKRQHSNKRFIINGLISAILLSLPLYLQYYNITNIYLNSIITLIAIYRLFTLETKSYFWTGFFIGIAWFYWVGFSFLYYDLEFLIPFVIIGFGLIYGGIFFLFNISYNVFIKAAYLLLITTYGIFGFDWFKIEVLLANSIFDVSKLSIAIIIFSVASFIYFKKFGFLAVIPLLFTLAQPANVIEENRLDISMPQMNIEQENKWNKEYISNILEENINLIEDAIASNKDLVILPETTLPLILNRNEKLVELLEDYSYKLDIILGSLYYENSDVYNATYKFSMGDMSIAKKVVLVPFGEEVPLPAFLTDFINNTFYNGAKDYKKALNPTDFLIDGVLFRNAICYEATNDKIYQNLDKVENIIAISNDAWFTPSIMPTLQKLLLKYYSRKYNVKIYHQINGSDNYIITP